MRLIDGDALIAWIKDGQQMTSKMKSLICYIKTMPTIDAVSVVRCADCVYCNVQNTKYLYAICQRHGIEFKPFEDDTRTHGCTWGERKESE